MAQYYTADRHLGHANIITMCNRPFTSVEDMDQTLVENICQRERPPADDL